MLITTRKAAQEARAGQYFTGKPCKSGHISNRYTQSGACSACVAVAAAKNRGVDHSGVVVPRAQVEAANTEKLRALAAARLDKSRALNELEEVRLQIHDLEDRKTIFETATGLCLAAYPSLERDDVWPSSQPIKGIPVYKVLIPSEHAKLIRDITDSLWAAKSRIDFSRFHHRLIEQVEKMANEADNGEEPQGWK